ncbi:MAG TPA: tRNA uridine-5-carboxymethylaminomethyl(34) synthesis GTPase MnmE [Clostridiales bacterium]|nr:MAG: tRNA modification GTPase MnmE [Firmicutes bacterium ADurb.Bin262]HOU09410.1 tRNA uridine-5-carboxymethylaminomethyl(34) synthesis GTPase MnmE [Clostridiales bacterium]HQK72294.1 tRNA uridine-5-carboxymethylaminomethyl(34) synthesis GTPase MnmE [Clostridiales bacterium]
MKAVAAISTAQAAGGIGIVRISGDEALDVAAKVFRPACGADVRQMAGYTARFGAVYDDGGMIDEAVCLVFRAPHSYTGEDTAEISCHGGVTVVRRVLQAVLAAGAEAAGPGEFTKRAFLNGKIDLARAEAVMKLIYAGGETASKAALNALEGSLSRTIRGIADDLIACAARLAAYVDYPDEDIEDTGAEAFTAVLAAAKTQLTGLLDHYESGRAVLEGVDTVLVGRPNVGKSALMNTLAGFERSIVTPEEGTTRDIVEQTVHLGGIVLRLADTAGLREPGSAAEHIGVEYAKKRLERADLVLAVFDGSDELTPKDRELLELCRGKRAVAVINKTDLPVTIDTEYISSVAAQTVEVSAVSGAGVDRLAEAVARLLGTDGFDPAAALLVSERQRACCLRALDSINEALDALANGVTLDAVGVCVDGAVNNLLELTGEKAGDAVVNEVFSRFCVGK